jgi:hypothetical protein
MSTKCEPSPFNTDSLPTLNNKEQSCKEDAKKKSKEEVKK